MTAVRSPGHRMGEDGVRCPLGWDCERSDLALCTLCFSRWRSGWRMGMRRQSRPPAGAVTAGGPACAPEAQAVSPGAWTAGGAAGTQCRTSRAPCRPRPAPAPCRLLTSSPVKCEISGKSKHNPALEKGTRTPKSGKEAQPHRCPGPSQPFLSPAYSLHLSHHPQLPQNFPRPGGPGDTHRLDLTPWTHLHLLVFLYYLYY